MATKKAFKMNNVNKVMFVHEFVMKMRDAKVIYALRKVIEKELKISFNEYVCNHLTDIDSVKNLFSDSMKLLTYKRNAELVKLSFDYKKIDSSWRKVVDKLINPTEEETKENTKVKASTKKEKVSNEETTKEVKKRGRKSKNEAKEDEEKKKKETTKVKKDTKVEAKKDTKVEAKKDTKTVVETKKTKTVVKKKDSKTVLAEAKKNEETEKAIAETTATTTSNEAK